MVKNTAKANTCRWGSSFRDNGYANRVVIVRLQIVPAIVIKTVIPYPRAILLPLFTKYLYASNENSLGQNPYPCLDRATSLVNDDEINSTNGANANIVRSVKIIFNKI